MALFAGSLVVVDVRLVGFPTRAVAFVDAAEAALVGTVSGAVPGAGAVVVVVDESVPPVARVQCPLHRGGGGVSSRSAARCKDG